MIEADPATLRAWAAQLTDLAERMVLGEVSNVRVTPLEIEYDMHPVMPLERVVVTERELEELRREARGAT
jgi:hypothetical protein